LFPKELLYPDEEFEFEFELNDGVTELDDELEFELYDGVSYLYEVELVLDEDELELDDE